MSVVRGAGLVVCRRISGRTEFLLLQASYPPHHWTPPKGHVDPGEDEWTAALRETKEEAGIDADDLVIYKNCNRTLQYEVKGKPKTVKYWLAFLKEGKDVKLSNEHQNSKWLEETAAADLADFKEMRDLIKEFGEYFKTV